MERLAIQGIVLDLKTMRDQSVRLTIDVDLPMREVSTLIDQYQTVAIAPIQAQSAAFSSEQRQKEKSKVGIAQARNALTGENRGEFGELAKELKLSGFFRIQSVYTHIGTDDEFLAWIRQRGRSATGMHPNENNPIEAAHIRRQEHGAGVGQKPVYSAIPLLHSEHANQHSKGESAIGDESWWQQQRVKYLEQWAWETLKGKLGYDSWRDVPPADLATWATMNGVDKYLPSCYRDYINAAS